MPVEQRDAIQPDSMGPEDWTCFWLEPAFHNLECLHAGFRRHVYTPHRHETYVIGVIEAGMEEFHCRGVLHRATAGKLALVNPFELHDGRPGPNGYTYRMLYPDPILLRSIAEEMFDQPMSAPHFPDTLVEDTSMSAQLAALHSILEHTGDPLERDSALMSTLATLIARHAEVRASIPTAGREPVALANAIDYINAHMDDAAGAGPQLTSPRGESRLDLAAIADAAGLSRFQLIRVFRKHLGQTPLAYVNDRRVQRARRLLHRGHSPAETAYMVGFCDQSHLHRVFKARVGVTPGAYRRARNRVQAARPQRS